MNNPKSDIGGKYHIDVLLFLQSYVGMLWVTRRYFNDIYFLTIPTLLSTH